MKNTVFFELKADNLEMIQGGGCSWGGLVRSVAKPSASKELRIINGFVYSLTCWW